MKDYLTRKYSGDENRYFVSRMIEYSKRCERTQQRIFTDFLDPIKVKIAWEISKTCDGISMGLYGGFEEAERRMAVILPEWDSIEPKEYPIEMLKMTDKGWGGALSHRDYLGALLGIGIKREKIGDLVVGEGFCLAAIHRDIAGFVETNMERAGRNSVTVEKVDANALELKPEFREMRITVTSPRLDGVIGPVFGLSRAKSAKLIAAGKVKVNWEVCTRTDTALQEGDIVSAGGKGKFKVREIAGVTKKGRTIVVTDKYI